MCRVIYLQRIGNYLGKTNDVLSGKRFVHLTVLSKNRIHQIVIRAASQHRKMIGAEFYIHFTRNKLLGVIQKRFDCINCPYQFDS